MKVGSLEDAHKPARKAGLAHSSLAKPQRKAVLASRRRNGRGTFIVSLSKMALDIWYLVIKV